jgi:hypothetical protein
MAAELHQLLIGKYFLATKVDRSQAPQEPGYAPNTISLAGYIKEATSDHRHFLVHIFARAHDLEGEDVKLSQRIMSTEELIKASLFPDYSSMEMAANNHLGIIESINLE